MELFILMLAVIVLIAVISITVYSLSKGNAPKDVRDIRVENEITRFGKEGEDDAYYFLRHFLEPHGYAIIRNAHIFYNGEESEIDNIIVGRTGVFIVEVKNMRGMIIGSCDDNNLMQYKLDNRDEMHSKSFYNPIKQVNTHTYRLAHFLRDNNIKVFIKNTVYFVNPEARVKINPPSEKTPVFQYSDRKKLIEYILGGEEKLSDSEMNKLVRLIKPYE